MGQCLGSLYVEIVDANITHSAALTQRLLPQARHVRHLARPVSARRRALPVLVAATSADIVQGKSFATDFRLSNIADLITSVVMTASNAALMHRRAVVAEEGVK